MTEVNLDRFVEMAEEIRLELGGARDTIDGLEEAIDQLNNDLGFRGQQLDSTRRRLRLVEEILADSETQRWSDRDTLAKIRGALHG